MTTYSVRLTFTGPDGVKRQLVVAKPGERGAVTVSGFERDYAAGRPHENDNVAAVEILRDAGIRPQAVVGERVNPADPVYTVQQISHTTGTDGEATRRCLEVDLGELDAAALARLERQVVPDEGQVVYSTPVVPPRELREPQLIDELFTAAEIDEGAFPALMAIGAADPHVNDPQRRGAGAGRLDAGDPGNLTAEQQQEARERAVKDLVDRKIDEKITDEHDPAGGRTLAQELADPAKREAARQALIDRLIAERAFPAVPTVDDGGPAAGSPERRGAAHDATLAAGEPGGLTPEQQRAALAKARQELEQIVKGKKETTQGAYKASCRARLRVVRKHDTAAQRDTANPDVGDAPGSASQRAAGVVDGLLAEGQDSAERGVLATHAMAGPDDQLRAVRFSTAADGSLQQHDGGPLHPSHDVRDVEDALRAVRQAHSGELAAAKALGLDDKGIKAIKERQQADLKRLNLLGQGALLHGDRAAYEAHLAEIAANRRQGVFHDPALREQTQLRPDDPNFYEWFNPDELMKDPVFKAKAEAIARKSRVDLRPDATGSYFGAGHANNARRMEVFEAAWADLYNPTARARHIAAYEEVMTERFGREGVARRHAIAAAERGYQPAILGRVMGYVDSDQPLTDVQRSNDDQVEQWVDELNAIDWADPDDFPVTVSGIDEEGNPYTVDIDFDAGFALPGFNPEDKLKEIWQANYYKTTPVGERKSYDDYIAEVEEQRVSAQRERTIDRWATQLEAHTDPTAPVRLTYTDVSGQEHHVDVAAGELRARCLDAEGKPDRAKLERLWNDEFRVDALDCLEDIDRIRHPSVEDMSDLTAQVRAQIPAGAAAAPANITLNLPGADAAHPFRISVPYSRVVTDGEPNLAGIREAWREAGGNLNEIMAGLPARMREEVRLRASHAVRAEVYREAQRRVQEQSHRQQFTPAQEARFLAKAKADLTADLTALEPAVGSIRGVVRADAGCVNLNRTRPDGTRLVTNEQVDRLIQQVILDHPEWVDRSGPTPTISAANGQNIADEVRARYEQGLEHELAAERARQVARWRADGAELDLGDGHGPRRVDITDAAGNSVITDAQLADYWEVNHHEAELQRSADRHADRFDGTLDRAAEREVAERLRAMEDAADNVYGAEGDAIREQHAAALGMSDEDFAAYVRRKKQEELMAMQAAGVYFDEKGCLRDADGNDITVKFVDTAIRAWGTKDQIESWNDILEFLEDSENPLMIAARLLIELFYIAATGMTANQANSEEGRTLRKLKDPKTLERATQLAADSIYINDKGEARVDLKGLMENKDIERGDKVAVVFAALRRGFEPEEIEGISANDPIMKQAKEVYQGYMQASAESARGRATAEIDKDQRGPKTFRWFTRSGWLAPHWGYASEDRKAPQPQEAAQRQRDESRRQPVRGRRPPGGSKPRSSATRRRIAEGHLGRRQGGDDAAPPVDPGPRGGRRH